MAYRNGYIPASALTSIPGSGPAGGPKLRKEPARAFTALHNYSMHRWGISMGLTEQDVGRAYRSYARQLLAKRTYGSNAAIPGTSNHGLGINVDLMTRQQRWVIDQVGRSFGFSKSWSDAQWEWWHITYRSGSYPLVTTWSGTNKTLHYGQKGPSIAQLQKLLRGHGYTKVPKPGKPGRGFFGKATRNAVKDFQRKHHLTADGICGPKTWAALRQTKH